MKKKTETVSSQQKIDTQPDVTKSSNLNSKLYISGKIAAIYANCYGVIIASTFGHELGHATLPYFYGEKVKIHVSPLGNGYTKSTLNYMPSKLLPLMSALGPIAGVLTCFGMLKTSNICNEISNELKKNGSNKNLKNAMHRGLKKPLLNKDQHPGLMTGIVYACAIQAMSFYSFKGIDSISLFGSKQTKSITDGQHICNYFNLSPTKGVFARNIMAIATLGWVAHTLDLYQFGNQKNKMHINRDKVALFKSPKIFEPDLKSEFPQSKKSYKP